MWVFELNTAQKYCLGSGVAPQTPIVVYTIGQENGFWIPMMVVFELHIARNYLLGFWGGAPNTHATVPRRPAEVFLDT